MRRILPLLLVLAISAGACHNWQPVTEPFAKLATAKQANRYRINLVGGGSVELEAVHIRNDSLLGVPVKYGQLRASRLPDGSIGFASKDVSSVQLQVADPAGTVLAVVGGVALGVGTLAVIAAAFDGLGGLTDWSSGGGGSSSGDVPLCSTPRIYSWDGREYRLDSGTFGGAIMPALARTDLDNLIYARNNAGRLRFIMTDEADELEHVDAFQVVAVDHPRGTLVAPDARANGEYHLFGNLASPRDAVDDAGRDALASIAANDDAGWESRPDGRDPSRAADLRDAITLTFTRPAGDSAIIVVDGENTPWAAFMMQEMIRRLGSVTRAWYDPATTSASASLMTRAQHGEGFLVASVWDNGAWREIGPVWEAGPEVMKRQVLPLDLRPIHGDQVRIRLEGAPSFWRLDRVALAPGIGGTATARTLLPVKAIAPAGRDVTERLASVDHEYVDMQRGDTVRVEMRDDVPVPRDMERSYLARTSGWYQIQGDDNARPDLALLATLTTTSHGAARVSIERMNAVLARLDREAHNAR